MIQTQSLTELLDLANSYAQALPNFPANGRVNAADVELTRQVVEPLERMGVKASGKIRTLANARAMPAAGANRLGTSAGVRFVRESAASV